jgi:hypothetical protein
VTAFAASKCAAVSFKRGTATTLPDAFETKNETGRRQDDQRPSGKIA